jgi:hypothetical protein
LGRTGDHGSFGPVDEDMINAFTPQAAMALRLAVARQDAEQVRRLDDRLQIANELQDRIVSRLFGVGLAMHGTAGQPAATDAIIGRVNEIDAVIRNIRAAVFSLNRPAEAA